MKIQTRMSRISILGRDDDVADDDDDVVVVVVVVVVMVAMRKMVMVKNNYGGSCWQRFFCCMSCWCLGGLSMEFGWSLVSGWPFGGVSVVS